MYMSLYHLVSISLSPAFSLYVHVAVPFVSLQIFLLVVHNRSKHKEYGSLTFKNSFENSRSSLDFKE